MDDEINYNRLVERALLNVVRESLKHAAAHGLPGQQHFYITFNTQFPGVSIPAHLKERYQEEMTIVLQHQFWDLVIKEDYFSLGLSFNHRQETLVIPFDAVTAFADPSVQFGLQFTITDDEDDLMSDFAEEALEEEEQADRKKPVTEEPKAGEVITLDAFRKK